MQRKPRSQRSGSSRGIAPSITPCCQVRCPRESRVKGRACGRGTVAIHAAGRRATEPVGDRAAPPRMSQGVCSLTAPLVKLRKALASREFVHSGGLPTADPVSRWVVQIPGSVPSFRMARGPHSHREDIAPLARPGCGARCLPR